MYINVKKAIRLGLIGRVKVYLNGKLVNKCIAAKTGRNGFVEAYTTPVKINVLKLQTIKKRGNVKITFSPKKVKL
jgi:hypothetical protein